MPNSGPEDEGRGATGRADGTAEPPRVILGTYEQAVVGTALHFGEKEGDGKENSEATSKTEFVHLFSTEAHLNAVTCLASSASGSLVASGSGDETIRLYDVEALKDYGALYGHEGEVTCLQFYGDGHLISGGGDGMLHVWSAKENWDNVSKLAAHKGGVTGLAVHPSGRLALSIGKDGYLKVWNLMSCTMAHRIKMRQTPTSIVWFPDGSGYTVCFEREIKNYDSQGELICEMKTGSKILSTCHLKDGTMAIGCENAAIYLFSTRTGEQLKILEGHNRRVRGLSEINIGNRFALVSGSSDGEIRVWDLSNKGTLIGSRTGFGRITCLVGTSSSHKTLKTNGKKRQRKKRKRKSNFGKTTPSGGASATANKKKKKKRQQRKRPSKQI
mmetsp:Transcript_9802/g.24111  ORF Transcript_9802/g.24111 Transcript_9802/m.24111 type:complete len:386 (-) Transcript_9802:186-1343(-)